MKYTGNNTGASCQGTNLDTGPDTQMTRRFLSPLTGLAAVSLALCVALPAMAQDQPGPATPAGTQRPGPGMAVRKACMADIQSLCAGIEAGGGRIGQCLREHRDQLSEGCKAAIEQARAARREGGMSRPPEGEGSSAPPHP